uniref:Uncharacterized protein n=1 Tax=mine drainage metagenome TaxID=410659 RepID=E6QWG5_9ZZZZ
MAIDCRPFGIDALGDGIRGALSLTGGPMYAQVFEDSIRKVARVSRHLLLPAHKMIS